MVLGLEPGSEPESKLEPEQKPMIMLEAKPKIEIQKTTLSSPATLKRQCNEI